MNRLQVTAWISAHPEVREERIERPLVIVGLPRTGTTLLSYLLDCDPDRRSLMRWEAARSVPPPKATTFTVDPRIEDARTGSALLDAVNPAFKAIHYEAPDGPTECVTILAQDFKSLQWSCLANVPGYDAWLLSCDHASAYAYHRRELQLLQSRAPGRWTLKTPHHCLAFDKLFDQYADARVVVLHRDPVRAVASLCSLVGSLAGTFTDADHRASVAAHWPDMASAIVDGLSTYRDRRGSDAFLDIGYQQLVDDPVGTVARIYEWAGEDLTPETRARMQDYVARNPQDRHGRHTYALDDLLLDRATLEERFADYRARYAIPHEPST